MSQPEPRRRPTTLVLAALALLVLVGFVLRWRGVGWGLPHQTYRDGMVISTQVDYLQHPEKDPGRDEFWGYYPHLMSRLILLAPDDWVGEPKEPLELEGHLARASEPWLMARKISVLLSLLAIPGAFFVARRFVGDGWALFAAALVTFSMFHLSFAQQEKPHGPVSGTPVLAVLAAMALARRPSVGTWTVATLAAAFSVATAINGAFALLSAAAAVVIVLVERRGQVAKLVAGGLLATAVVLYGTVRYFYPFLFFQGEAEKLGDNAVNVGNHPLDLDKLTFAGAKNMFLTLYLYEPMLLVLMIVGVVVFVVRRRRREQVEPERRRDFLVILPFLAVYGSFLLVYEDAFDRFLMPIVPFLAALAAYGASALTARIRSQGAVVALATLLLVEPAAATTRLMLVRATPDTPTQIAHWIETHVEPGQRVLVLPYVDLPLFYSDAAVAESPDASSVLTWMSYQAKLDTKWKLGPRYTVLPPRAVKRELKELGEDPLGAVRARGADYVVIQSFGERYRYKELLRLRDELRTKGERVFVASPREGDEESGRVWIREKMTLNQVPTWIRVFTDHSTGTVLEIYRVPKEEAR
ncbi:MAG: hypothetical protein NTV21_07920 [Planctomycetota bacterium]|nr:hypothetical protein [Planctomycetota bacterium]